MHWKILLSETEYSREGTGELVDRHMTYGRKGIDSKQSTVTWPSKTEFMNECIIYFIRIIQLITTRLGLDNDS